MNIIISVFLLLTALTGCSDSSGISTYTEKHIESPLRVERSVMNPHQNMGSDMLNPALMASVPPAGKTNYTWSVPEVWQELPGSGMRMASFQNRKNPEAVDVSIIELSGMAGGVHANLTRWMGQIGIPAENFNMDQFVRAGEEVRSAAGFEGRLYDFAILQDKEPENTGSIMAVVFTLEDKTLFIKMTGSIEALKKNREALLQLTESITQGSN